MIHGAADGTLTDLSALDDRALIGRFDSDRDERAFAMLVSRHSPMVLRICRRIMKNEHDAEDACQAVFLLMARKAGKVRWHECVANWLYGAAVRIASNANRRQARNRTQEIADPQAVAPVGETGLVSAEIESVLYQELDRLPEKYRAPVVLCHLEGRSRRQTADELGLSETTVKGRLERAREMLRWKLGRRGLALPAALFAGELAREISEAAISDLAAIQLAQAAAKFAVGDLLASTSTNAVTLAKGELAKMLLATQFKWVAMTVAVTGALGTGAALTSSFSSGGGAASISATATKAAPSANTDHAIAAPQPFPDVDVALVEERPKEVPAEEESESLDGGAITEGLRSLSLAMHGFHSVNKSFPAAATYNANQKPLLSWRVHLLPFLGEKSLYAKFRHREPWNSAHNKALIEKMPAIYAAGSDALHKAGKTIFLAPVGSGMAIGRREATTLADFKDGTSNTILLLTVQPQHAVVWTEPADWEFDEKKPFDKLLGKNGDGFRFAACDGSVRRFSEPLPPEQLKALLTRAGGEVVSSE